MHIDWENAVFVSIVLTLTVGIYAGLIASRIFAFFQVRAKAAAWILELKKVIGEDHESPFQLSVQLTEAAHGILIEVRSLGHEKAIRLITGILAEYLERLAQLVQVPVPASRIPIFPDKNEMIQPFAIRGAQQFGNIALGKPAAEVADYFWRELTADFRDFYVVRLSKDVARIASSRPNFWAIITPFPFPNYLAARGDLIGFMISRPPWWRVLLGYNQR